MIDKTRYNIEKIMNAEFLEVDFLFEKPKKSKWNEVKLFFL